MSARGYGIDKRGLPDGVLDAVRKATTVSPAAPPIGPPPPAFKVHLESKSKIYVPMYLGLACYGQPQQQRPPRAAPLRPEAAFVGDLRPSQEEPVAAFLAAARDPARRGGIINMVCAAGKTVMALHIVAALGKRALVVVHKEFLMNQWRERAQQFLPGASIGLVQGPVFDVDGRDVVLCMLQTLASRQYDLASAGFGTVVVDECHHTSAEVFSRALHCLNFDHSLGLSATIRRKDGLGHVFQWFLGPVVFRSRRVKETGVAVEAWEFRSSDPAYRAEEWIFGKQLNLARMISNVCAHFPRTLFIARLALRARREGRVALVLSERRSHLLDIERAIRDEAASQQLPGTVGYYVGGLKPADLKRAESCDVVLGTFAMAAEGMDIPALNTLILASPKTDIEQSVGRILRVRADLRAVEPLVIDVVDPFSVFASQACRRAAFYKRCGYQVRRLHEGLLQAVHSPTSNPQTSPPPCPQTSPPPCPQTNASESSSSIQEL
jgi:superfamily II DNA or RNA helicase